MTGVSVVSTGAELDSGGTLEFDSGVEEPASLPAGLACTVEEADSPVELASASEPLLDSRSLVEGADADPEALVAVDEDPSLDCGVCAGARSVEVPVEVPLPGRVPDERVARWAPPGAFACVFPSVFPGKALAATAVSTPVSVALAAISRRLARLSRRRAASREREV